MGNKSDLEKERIVTPKDALEFSKQKEIPFIETSAREDKNIKDALILLIADFLQVSLV